MPAKEKLKKDELEKFRKMLVARKELILNNMAHLEGEALKNSQQDASGDLSKAPSHLADLGSDSYEQEFNLGLMESEEQELLEIEGAIERMGTGKFGICEECETFIGRDRLQAIPYTKLCITCKRKEEGE